MRISTTQIYEQGANAILDQQAKVLTTQLQVASGKRILSPADDPAGAVQALDLGQVLAQTKQYQANADAARDRQRLEEDVLAGVGDAIQRLRELAVQGNNDTLADSDRRSLAVEARQLVDHLLALANTQDGQGEHLFAGYKTKTQPFARNAAGNFVYSGDDGQRFAQIGPNRQVAVSDSGTEVFRAIRNGNGTFTTLDNPANTGSGIIDPGTVTNISAYVADNFSIQFTSATTYDVIDTTTAVTVLAAQTYVEGATIGFNGIQTSVTGQPAVGDSFTISPSGNQDLLTTAQNLAEALEAGTGNGAARAQLHNALNRFLSDVDRSLDSILNIRARVGARLSAIDDQKNVHDGLALQIEGALSRVQDLDYAEAVTRLQQQLLGLQAAQQAFVKVEQLSLFNYL